MVGNNNRIGATALGLLVGVGMMATGQRAEACGGCFAPPNVPQVVTDHRMVLAIHPSETYLWDQFQYAGDPRDFSWIFPLRYTDDIQIGVGTDAFIDALGNITAPSLRPPPWPYPPCPSQSCPQPQDTWSVRDSGAAPADAPSPVDTSAPPVTVLREEVVGPYEVRIIRGEDPMAIRTWLRANGYVVPTAIEPVIDFYTGLSMDYIALRLRPETGLNRMAPIRIRFPGAMPRLPLRMIAAGVADRVGLSLVVLANGGYEAENFPNAEYHDDDFTFDWQRPGASPVEHFVTAFEGHNTRQGGRVWLGESRLEVGRGRFAFLETSAFSRDAGQQFAPEGRADLNAAFGTQSSRSATRLRANLLASMLDRDLELRARDDNTQLGQFSYGHQVNIPPPPTCSNGARWNPATRQFEGGQPFPPCPDAGIPGTGFDAGSRPRDGGTGFDAGSRLQDGDTADEPVEAVAQGGCSVGSPARPSGQGVAAAGLVLGLLAWVRRRASRPSTAQG